MPKIAKTQQYGNDLKRIYRFTLRRFGPTVALETKHQVEEAEQRLADGLLPDKADPDYHSDRFSFISICNSQKLFYERSGDTIYMVTAGYDRRNWKEHLKALESYADQQIARARKRSKEGPA
jgi:plasmid stabilization system protein ParE